MPHPVRLVLTLLALAIVSGCVASPAAPAEAAPRGPAARGSELVAVALTPDARHASFAASRTSTAWWQRQIDRALAEPDSVKANLATTRLHYLLAESLDAVLGHAAGANFHHWCTWGSRRVGVTLRGRDFEVAFRSGGLSRPGLEREIAKVGIWLGRGPFRSTLARWRRNAKSALSAGNRLVLRATAAHTAAFLAAFHDLDRPDPARLARFVARFRPGTLPQGGEDLLRAGYTRLYEARFASSVDARQELVYFASLLFTKHEQTHLQAYVRRAIPREAPELTTRWLMDIRFGDTRLAMNEDVRGAFAPSLETLHDVRLRSWLFGRDGIDTTEGRRRGSAVRTWSDLRERLGFIAVMFRVHHTNPEVTRAPFTDARLAAIARFEALLDAGE